MVFVVKLMLANYTCLYWSMADSRKLVIKSFVAWLLLIYWHCVKQANSEHAVPIYKPELFFVLNLNAEARSRKSDYLKWITRLSIRFYDRTNFEDEEFGEGWACCVLTMFVCYSKANLFTFSLHSEIMWSPAESNTT